MQAMFGLSPQGTRQVLVEALRAPSVLNSQPWRVRLSADRVEVFADLSRHLPFADPRDQGMYLACGALVANLRIGLLARGVTPAVALEPHGADSRVAVITTGPGVAPAGDWHELARAIRQRRTNRRPYQEATVPPAETADLVRAAQDEGAVAYVVADVAQRATLRRLVTDAEAVQRRTPGYQDEWQAWTGRGGDSLEGVPLSAAGPKRAAQDEWVLRDFSAGRAAERAPGKDFESEPLLIVVCSNYAGRLAELVAGQAMQRLLLAATAHGLAASFVSQPLEVPDTASRLRVLVGGSLVPQTILRIGYGSPVPATPRRPLEDVLVG